MFAGLLFISGKTCVAVVIAYYFLLINFASYFLPCAEERHLDNVGTQIIDYLDNLEDDEYAGICVYHMYDGDSNINLCTI